jgi:hypothetical protein
MRPKSVGKRNIGDGTRASVTVAPSPSRSTDDGIRAPHVRGRQLCGARGGGECLDGPDLALFGPKQGFIVFLFKIFLFKFPF